MIEFIKDLFNGSRFVNSKYLDNQFDCFIDYVDITEEDLEAKIESLEYRIESLEENLVFMSEINDSLIMELELSSGIKNNDKSKPAKVSKKVKVGAKSKK